MMGIVSTAWPLTLGTGMCRPICAAIIAIPATAAGKSAIGLNSPRTMVSTMRPSSRTTKIAPSDANDHGRQRHVAKAGAEGACGAAEPEPALETGSKTYDEEQSREVIEVPAL